MILFFTIFLATTTECDLCNKNGKCVLDGDNTNGPSNVRCECQPWFAGRNCQINLQLLLIVGCVSVILMIVIACCVSCLCCRDRHNPKNSIPCKFIFYLILFLNWWDLGLIPRFQINTTTRNDSCALVEMNRNSKDRLCNVSMQDKYKSRSLDQLFFEY